MTLLLHKTRFHLHNIHRKQVEVKRLTMKKLYLVRHAETLWNEQGRLQGTMDISLSGKGILQTCKTVRRLAELPISVALTSPLKRARVLAGPVARIRGINLIELPQLRERGFGAWEGLTWSQVCNRFPHEAMLQESGSIFLHPAGGGESLLDVLNRACQVRKYIENSPFSTILIVGHGSFNCVFITALLELPLETCKQFMQANACISVFRQQPHEKWQAVMINSTCHLTRNYQTIAR